MEFGNRLKALRTAAGLTQSQLAAQIHVTKSVVSYYELQERSPSPEVLVKLSYVFHVSTDYLLGREPGETVDVTGLDERDIALVRALVERLRSDGGQG